MIFKKKKKPNYIFLNHGYLCGKKIKFMSKDQLERTIYVNLVSYVSVLEQIKSLKKCKTVVMSSISGSAGSYDNLYASTKAGINLISKKITSQIDRNSRINLISPGIIKDAKMTLVRRDYKNLVNKIYQTPTKNLTSSFEVAYMVFYLFFYQIILMAKI